MDIFNRKRVAELQEQCRQKQARIDRINKAADEFHGYGGAFDVSAFTRAATGQPKKDVFNIISEAKASKKEIEILKSSLKAAENALAYHEKEVRLSKEKRTAKRKAKKLKKKAKADLELINAHIKVGDRFECIGVDYVCTSVREDACIVGAELGFKPSYDTKLWLKAKDLPLIKVVKAKK